MSNPVIPPTPTSPPSAEAELLTAIQSALGTAVQEKLPGRVDLVSGYIDRALEVPAERRDTEWRILGRMLIRDLARQA